MTSQGFISLPAGIALAFGANIGTCITAVFAAIGKLREAVRAAAVHVLFNDAGGLVWPAFIPQLAELIATISPTHLDLPGVDRLAAETPRQITNAHTIVVIANTLLFIGLSTQLARFVERMIPDKPFEEEILSVTARTSNRNCWRLRRSADRSRRRWSRNSHDRVIIPKESLVSFENCRSSLLGPPGRQGRCEIWVPAC
jgi:hypothetical protein